MGSVASSSAFRHDRGVGNEQVHRLAWDAFTTGEVPAPYAIGHLVGGGMRGSHHMPLMPVPLNTGIVEKLAELDSGFRKVRRLVCKRLGRRLSELGLADLASYRAYPEDRPGEWETVDRFCRIPVSRFYRDRSRTSGS